MTDQTPVISPGKDHKRTAMIDARMELRAVGDRRNHDAGAARAGVSRRTVYRYFPDQDALRHAAWARMSPHGHIPDTREEMLDGLEARFAKFARNAAALTVALASSDGRALRHQLQAARDV